jgi:hypothetical protein
MVTKEMIVVAKTQGFQDAVRQFNKMGDSLKSLSVIQQVGGKSIRDSYTATAEGIKQTSSIVEDHRQRFKMYLLSIMFFGMIIQRTFQKMATTTLDAFMKITEAQTSAGQAVSALSAHWEYLKFSIGEAIGAFIEANPWIIELINNIADFVQQNGKLIATLIIAGIVFGGTLGLIGQFGLGISGITMSIRALTGGAGISGLTTALAGLAVPILLIVAALGILWWAWNTNFLNIRQTIGTMVMGLQAAWDGGIKVIFRNIGAGLIVLGGVFGWILGTIGYSWEALWLGMYRGASIIWNNILAGLQALYNGFVDIVNGIIYVQNLLVEKTGFGEKWAYVQKANLSGWMQDTDKA